MRGIDELDHYEMLEIPRGASPGEIDRAYRMAQETYAEGSLALYSIFEKGDASEIRAQLDEAYRVLADPELRARYDQSHGAVVSAAATSAAEPSSASPSSSAARSGSTAADAHSASHPASYSSPSSYSAPLATAPAHSSATASSLSVSPAAERSAGRAANGEARGLPAVEESARVARAAEAAVIRVFEEDAERYDGRDDELGGEYDGPRLRRTRLFRGYEIDQIADVTKVSGSHLRNIEDENFADLPADVYVRGFVTAYAKTIGLDPVQVVPSYMTRLQESRQKTSPSRFLGLR